MEFTSNNFKIQDFGFSGSISFANSSSLLLDLSFLSTLFNNFDYFISFKIRIYTTSTIATPRNINLYYNNDSNDVVVDYATNVTLDGNNYLEFDITNFVASKKHFYTNIFLKNNSGKTIYLSADNVNVFYADYIKSNQLFGNKNTISSSVQDFSYTYNYITGKLCACKTLNSNLFPYSIELNYCNESRNLEHFHFKNGWNVNLLEYLIIQNGIPKSYIDDCNCVHEIEIVEGLAGCFYTNDGSGLIIRLIEENNVTTYKLYSEISKLFKIFNDEGKIIRVVTENNDYLEYLYSNDCVNLLDSNGNEIEIEYDSIDQEVSITINSSLNYLITLSSNGVEFIEANNLENSFYYTANKLSLVLLANNKSILFDYSGILLSEIGEKCNSLYLEKCTFEYDYLKTTITNRHGVKQFYCVDKQLNKTSSGELNGNDVTTFVCSKNEMLVRSVNFSIKDKNPIIYEKAQGGGTTINLNSSSNVSESIRLKATNATETIKKGQTYIFMASLAKNSDVVLRGKRMVEAVLYDDYETTEICRIKFNPYIRKQTQIVIFTAPMNSLTDGYVAKVTAQNMYSFGGGVTLTNVLIYKVDSKATSYFIRKVDNDGLIIPSDASNINVDSKLWYLLDSSEDSYIDGDITITRYYSFKDLIRNYINVANGLPLFWDNELTHLTYSYKVINNVVYDDGFHFRGKINTFSNNSAFGKKEIIKYYSSDGSEKEVFAFDYLEFATENNANIFYLKRIIKDDQFEYKTSKILNSDFQAVEEIDNMFDYHQSYLYNQNNLLIKSTHYLPDIEPIKEEHFEYDSKKRLISESSFVQDDFETIGYNYVSNYDLIFKKTNQSGVQMFFAYDSYLYKNVSISIGNTSIIKTYNDERLSSITNDSSFNFQTDQYGNNSLFYIGNNLSQQIVIALSSEDYFEKIYHNSTTPYRYTFNKYGNIRSIDERASINSDTLTNKVDFLYFGNRSTAALPIVTTQTQEVKSNFKLYKIVDKYDSVDTLFDYYDDGKIKERSFNIKQFITYQNVYKINYTFDFLDRLSTQKITVANSKYILYTFNYRYQIINDVVQINCDITGLLSAGKNIRETVARDYFKRVVSIVWDNTDTGLNHVYHKMLFSYIYKNIFENNAWKQLTSDYISKIDYYKPKLSGNSIISTYDRADYVNYDSCGNITSIVHGTFSDITPNTGVLYSYDSLNQLTQEINYDLGLRVNYSYDNNGNITCVTKTNLSNNQSTSELFSYHNVYRDMLLSVGGQYLSYDGNDYNITSIGDDIYFYWTRGRLLESASKGTKNNYFVYNYDGIRTKKTDSNNKVHTYILDDKKILGEKIKSGNTTTYVSYLYGQNGIFAFIYNGHIYYYQKNILGDITHIYDGPTLVARYVYDAYGNHKIFNENGDDITDSNFTHIGHLNPFRYRGYYYDEDIEIYYCSARYYSPLIRRWINADEFKFIDENDVLGLNLFMYCRNNPIKYNDKNGNSVSYAIIALLLAAFLLGGGTQLVINAANGATGLELWKGVAGSALGSLANMIALLFAPFSGGGLLLFAAGVGALTSTTINIFESSICNETIDWRAESINAFFDFCGNAIGNFVAAKLIPTNKGWFMPKHFISLFAKRYGQRLLTQLVVGNTFNLITGVQKNAINKKDDYNLDWYWMLVYGV